MTRRERRAPMREHRLGAGRRSIEHDLLPPADPVDCVLLPAASPITLNLPSFDSAVGIGVRVDIVEERGLVTLHPGAARHQEEIDARQR